MGGFYSFRVFAPCEVIIIENFVALDEGMNTFNCHVNDIDEFVRKLKAEDVRIDSMHHLDAPVPPEDVEHLKNQLPTSLAEFNEEQKRLLPE